MPDETQQPDVAQRFKSLRQDRQKALIQKMTPDQKAKLKSAILASQTKKTAEPVKEMGAKDTAKAVGKAAVEGYKDYSVGFAKAAGDVSMTIAKGINKIPVVGEKLSPKAGIQAGEDLMKSSNTMQSVGKVGEGIVEFAAGAEAIEGLSAALKAKNIPAVVKIIQRYPWLAKYAGVGIKNYTLGAGQSLAHGDLNPNKAGLYTAATGVLGEQTSSLFSKYSPKAAVKTQEAMNRYLGLSQKDMPKWERLNVGDVREVGKTVIERVGVKGSVEEQAHAIETARSNVQAQTERVVKGGAARAIPLKQRVDQVAAKVADEMEQSMPIDRAQLDKAIQANVDWVMKNKILTQYGTPSPFISAEDALKLRREIDDGIKWSSFGDSTNIQQMFRSELRSALNQDIESALSPAAAKDFSNLNRIHSRLIIARDAARGNVVRSGLTGKVVGAGGGAALGGYEGYTHGGAKGAVVGAAAGAVAGAAGGKAITDPKTQLLARRSIEGLLPTLRALAKKSPALQSSLSSVLGNSGGTGSISSNQ
jgi:hypothetical protein